MKWRQTDCLHQLSVIHHHLYTPLTMSSPLSRALRSATRLSRPQTYLPRTYATLSPYTPTPTAAYEVFDEPSKARQRDRALLRLRSKEGGGDTSVVDYLREELAERLSERIEVCPLGKGGELMVGFERATREYHGFMFACWFIDQGVTGSHWE
jgi:hypothetical protein